MKEFPNPPTLLIRSDNKHNVLKGIFSACNTLGWRVINLKYAEDYVITHQVPIGAILMGAPQESDVKQLRQRGIPIVSTTDAKKYGVRDKEFQQDGCVLQDRYAAGSLAADAFMERGFDDLALVSFEEGIPKEDSLFVGFQDQAKKHGATLHVCNLEIGDGTNPSKEYETQLKDIEKWLKAQPKPLAILALNYTMGLRILAASEMAELSVPDQVAIACQGNDEWLCKTAPVPLSSVDMNDTEVGRQSVMLIKRLLTGAARTPDPIYVPVKGFVERRSTDIRAVSDPKVARAVRFIWDHLDRPLTVDRVAREVCTSRNTLERAFRRFLNRGVHAELIRKRLDFCKELLRSTNMALPEIAKASGFNSSRHFHRAFRSSFDITPNEYRKSQAGRKFIDSV